MKILFISHDDGKYGAALSLRKLITLLKNNYGVTPVVITRKPNELNDYCSENEIENYYLHFVGCITYICDNPMKNNYFTIKQSCKNNIFHHVAEMELKRKVDLKTIDLVYSNVSTIDFGAWLAQKHNIPHVWHIREFMDKDMKGRPASQSYIDLVNKSKAVICISKVLADAWKKKGVKSSRIKIIYNGIDDEQSYKPKEIFYHGGNLKCVFMGSAAKHKGADHLIEAVGIVKKAGYNVCLDIYGNYENEYGQGIKKKVNDLNLSECVNFMGFHENAQSMLSQYDVGLVCSESEAFGRVTIEYMLNELAVVASNTGANPEIIVENTGILYPYGNSHALADALIELIKHPELVREYAVNARTLALEKYSAHQNAKKIFKLLDAILNKE